MLQHSPGLTSPVLQTLLEQSATDLGPAGKDSQFGSGLVDGCRAMLQLTGGARCRMAAANSSRQGSLASSKAPQAGHTSASAGDWPRPRQ
jgi:hypothetical protein